MKFHIVQMNETIDEILFLYNLSKDELIEENRHIKKWDRLIPGTKLKIPIITDTIDNEVMEMEPFIEDYYPKLKQENFDDSINVSEIPAVNEEKIVNQSIEENEGKAQKLDPSAVEEEKSNEINKDETRKEEQVISKMEEESGEKINITSEQHQHQNKNKNRYNYYYHSNLAPRLVYPIYYYPVYYPIIRIIKK